MTLVDNDGATSRDETWTMLYNDLNQLKYRFQGTWADGTWGEERFSYTYDDHRMAMSLAVAGIRIPGIVLLNPACVSKTFPDFFERFSPWVSVGE